MIHRVKAILTTRIASAAILFIALLGRITQVIYFFNFRSDRGYQILGARNFVQGHGISLAQVHANDLSTATYQPITEWPPGYSFLFAPFYKLWPEHYMVTGLVIDILSAVALLLISRAILAKLGGPRLLVNLYTLVAGFFIYEFIFISSSDLNTLAFFMAAMYCVLIILQKHTSPWRLIALTALLLICSSALKFMFLPLALLVPVFILMKSFVDRNSILKRSAGMLLLLTSCGLAALILYQKLTTGTPAKVYSSVYGFFPSNLSVAYPFLPAAFLRESTPISVSVNQSLHRAVILAYSLINLVMLGVLLALMLQHKRIRHLSTVQTFRYLCAMLSLAVLLMLVVLSVTLQKVFEVNDLWIYIQEGRYFGLVTIFIHIFFFASLNALLRLRFRWLTYLACLLLFMECAHGALFCANRVVKLNREEYSWVREQRLQNYTHQLLADLRRQTGINRIVVTGSQFYLSNRISMRSDVPILYAAELVNNPTALHSKVPVLLLVMIHKASISKFQPFLSWQQRKKVGEFGGMEFYLQTVEN